MRRPGARTALAVFAAGLLLVCGALNPRWATSAPSSPGDATHESAKAGLGPERAVQPVVAISGGEVTAIGRSSNDSARPVVTLAALSALVATVFAASPTRPVRTSCVRSADRVATRESGTTFPLARLI